MKLHAVVLNRQWAHELGAVIEPYLETVGRPPNDLPVLYARKIKADAPMLEATADRDGVPMLVCIPYGAVMAIVETTSERRIGFV